MLSPKWKDSAYKHLFGTDHSYLASHTIRPPLIRTENLPGRCRSAAGQLMMFDQADNPHPEFLRAVAICRGYFCRELGGQYVGYDPMNATVIVMPDDDRRVVLGALDFELHEGHPAHLCWAYIHPDWRRKGAMTDAIRDLRSRHKDFTVEFPVSPGMRSILRKMNHPQAEMENPSYSDFRYRS